MVKNVLAKAGFSCFTVLMLFSLASCDVPPEIAEASASESTVAQTAAKTGVQEAEAADETGVNMVQNGDFSAGIENWHLYLTSGGKADLTETNGEGQVNIQSSGTKDYSVQLYYDGFKLQTGGIYRFAFDMRADIDRNICARLQINGGDYSAYIEDFSDINADMQRYACEFTMEAGSDPAPRLCFNIGTPKGGDQFDPHTVTLDNVEVTLLDGSKILKPEPKPERPDININQLGYKPGSKKIAVFRGDELGDTFQVLDENGKVAFEGFLTGPIKSVGSQETNYTGDFSELKNPGIYHIQCGDAVESYSFTIAEDVYEEAFKAVFQMLYLQRCGCELDADIAGGFAHDACHTGEAIIYGTNETLDVSGGWHDAGDYGRYVVPGAKAVADLLFAYQDFGDMLGGETGDALGIPESNNGIPDVLDEARYELEWMLKMQDKQSGGVYHKATGLEFSGEVSATEDTQQLYLLPISTTATGDFAAVMAMSATIYEPFDKAFAKDCLDAAVKAWGYLEDNMSDGFVNPEDVLTGEYPDKQDTDERYWAAAALYQTTGDKKYLEAFEKSLELFVYILDGYGWQNVGGYGNRIYLSLDASETNPEYIQKIKDAMRKKADTFVANARQDGYGSSLGLVYPWGSNMTVCNNAAYLYHAGSLFGNEDNLNAVDSHFHYIFGANPMSTCYVSGFGTVSPQHPHHRPSMAMDTCMPGMLIGGPNSHLEDPYAKAVLAEAPPAKCYADNAQSFSCNEVTVYWNAPLVYLMALYMNS